MTNASLKPPHSPGTIYEELHHFSHLKEQQICALRQIKRAKLWKDTKAGLFPAPVRLGNRCTRWIAGDVMAYLADPLGWVNKQKGGV